MAISHRLISKSNISVITPDEFIEFAGLEESDDQEGVEKLCLDVALEQVEAYTGFALRDQVWRTEIRNVPQEESKRGELSGIPLPRRPFDSTVEDLPANMEIVQEGSHTKHIAYLRMTEPSYSRTIIPQGAPIRFDIDYSRLENIVFDWNVVSDLTGHDTLRMATLHLAKHFFDKRDAVDLPINTPFSISTAAVIQMPLLISRMLKPYQAFI